MLEIDERGVAQFANDAWWHYGLACALALTGSNDRALDELRAAIRLEPGVVPRARTDDDFRALQTLPAFKAIVDGVVEHDTGRQQ